MKPRHTTLAPKVRFGATVGQGPVVEVALVRRSGASTFLFGTACKAFVDVSRSGFSANYVLGKFSEFTPRGFSDVHV